MLKPCEDLYDEILSGVKDRVASGASKAKLGIICNGGKANAAMVKALAKDCETCGVPCVQWIGNDVFGAVLALNAQDCTSIVVADPLNDDRSEIAQAVHRLLVANGLDVYDGVDCVVQIIGRGKVGKAVRKLLESRGYTIITCHSKTSSDSIFWMSEEADAIVTCTNKPNQFDSESFRNANALIIDCGFEYEDGRPCGNVVQGSYYNQTPVPGGVTKLTRAVMVANAERRI